MIYSRLRQTGSTDVHKMPADRKLTGKRRFEKTNPIRGSGRWSVISGRLEKTNPISDSGWSGHGTACGRDGWPVVSGQFEKTNPIQARPIPRRPCRPYCPSRPPRPQFISTRDHILFVGEEHNTQSRSEKTNPIYPNMLAHNMLGHCVGLARQSSRE